MSTAAPIADLVPARDDVRAEAVAGRRPAPWSGLAAVAAGALTAFTVSLVGQLPLGEVVLFASAAWALVCAGLNRTLPGRLFHDRLFWLLLAGQTIALLAYAAADFSRQSAPADIARGWARMVFLAVDIAAVAYLFGRSAGNFAWLLTGQLAGDLLHTYLHGALFGDVWKFGCGIPATYAALAVAARAGPAVTAAVAAGLAALHFHLDFRSAGGLCLVLAALAVVQCFAPAARRWLLPLGVAAALGAVALGHDRLPELFSDHRATRSDVDRSAMTQAAAEAFRDSPLLGHGSWFSRSDVYDNFLQIRADLANDAAIGGFAGPNEEPGDVALHSQLLVALAEGGIFGGMFFLVYGVALATTLRQLVFGRFWRGDAAVRQFLLLLALWHLFMSPFSGAHRILIAVAAGLMLLVRSERPEKERHA